MEIQTAQDKIPTKEAEEFVSITGKEADEYRLYKKRQKIAEITGAISRSTTLFRKTDNVEKVLQQASRFHQAAVRMTPLQLYKIKGKLFNRSVKVDCVIGGSGETTAKVKAYEAKKARKMGAKELTLVLAPSLILSCAYSEIRKEVKKIKRAAKKCAVKVWVDNKYAFSTIAALARVCSDAGIDYFCVPQFSGCERLRFDLFRNCSLEISDVENLADFKKMTGAGVRRIVTSHVSDIYLEWMKEVNDGEKPPLEEKEKPELKIV